MFSSCKRHAPSFPVLTENWHLQSAYASDVLYLTTLYLSKCCVHFLYLHLTPNRTHNRASWAVMGLSTVWVICSIFMIGVNCELNQPWANIAARCSSMVRALSLSRILSEWSNPLSSFSYGNSLPPSTSLPKSASSWCPSTSWSAYRCHLSRRDS